MGGGKSADAWVKQLIDREYLASGMARGVSPCRVKESCYIVYGYRGGVLWWVV